METFTVTAVKERVDSKLGMLLSQKATSEHVIIKVLLKSSPFANSKLQVGMMIQSINGIPIGRNLNNGKFGSGDRSGLEQATEILKSSVGKITIQARGHVISIEKPSKDSPVGVGLIYSPTLDAVLVSRLASDSLFLQQGTKLQVGQKVTAVNGVECLQDAASVISTIRNAPSTVSLITLDPDFYRVTVTKRDSKNVGLTLVQHEKYDDVLVISKVEGVFLDTEIQVGQQLVSINGQACPENVSEAMELLQQSEGQIHLETVDAPLMRPSSPVGQQQQQQPPESHNSAPTPAQEQAPPPPVAMASQQPKQEGLLPAPTPTPNNNGKKQQPMIFAIMRNGHEVIRDAMAECQRAVQKGDLTAGRKSWYVLRAWSTLHHRLEEGDGMNPSVSPKGFFRVLDDLCEGVATKGGLLEQHEELELAEASVTEALVVGDMNRVATAYEDYQRINTLHLKWEEDIMMPQVMKMKQAGVPLKKIMRLDLLALLNQNEMQFFIEFAVNHLSRRPNPTTLQVFCHALWGVATPEEWEWYNGYIQKSIPPAMYQEMGPLFER